MIRPCLIVSFAFAMSCSGSETAPSTPGSGTAGPGTGGAGGSSTSSSSNSSSSTTTSTSGTLVGAGTGGDTGATGTGGGGAGTGGSGNGGSGGTTGGSGGTAGSGGRGTGGSSGAGGAGGAGGGKAGAAGSGGSGGSGNVNLAESVLERGKNPARTAHFVQPTLTTADVSTKFALDTGFTAKFNGNVSGVPLFLASTTPGKGLFFVATLSNNVYALDETTGAVVWTHSIGAGGHGVISTPVIDATARAIYVAADVGGLHSIHALSVDTGNEVTGWPVDVSKLKASNNYTFNSVDQNQRGALSLVGTTLYVPYGGYYGDGGNYRGWVVAVDTRAPTNVAGWATDGQQEGIWAPGGMASDGNGVFAITGNNGSTPTTHLDSEEVIRITGLAVPHRDAANLFYPTIWRSGMDIGDKDFGSCSPLVVALPGGMPASLLVAPAKPGHVYFLNSQNLGGLGGQVRDLVVADQGAESVYVTPTAYTSTSGVHIVISTLSGAVCPAGTTNNQLMSIRLDTSTTPFTPRIAWCATTNADDNIRRRSPVSTTTNGTANAIVWFMNGTKLNAFDGETGAVIYNGGTGTSDCLGVRRHTSPIAANGRIIVGADGHLCSWSVHP